MKLFLLYNQYYSLDGSNRKIGGVETYIENLATLFSSEGIEVCICQLAKAPFEKDETYAKVIGLKCNNVKDIYTWLEPKLDKSQDIVIFMNYIDTIKNTTVKTISIQHGISWDIPEESGSTFTNKMKRLRYMYNVLRWFNNNKYSVCVDYNFYNWYKCFTIGNQSKKKIWVIPNFVTQVLNENKRNIDPNHIKIIFARRFQEFRGAILFSEVAKRIMKNYPNIFITMAGEGPCEKQMKDILKDYSDRVTFIKYLPKDSFEIHKSHDIAVIPSIGSEGTSLSLLEAMGAGCVVVATPIGGMSNIVIDGYNGLLAMPSENSLYEKIKAAIIMNLNERNKMIANSINSVENGFSLNKWRESWKEVIKKVSTSK